MSRNSKRPKNTTSSSSPTKRAKTATVSSTAALSSGPVTCTLPAPLIAAASASESAATSTVAEIAELVSVAPTPTASDTALGTHLRTNAELLDTIDLVLDERGAHAATEVAAAPEDPAAAVARPASLVPITNWTVKNPGKVSPPTCNDYDTWTVVQLRKECTERRLRLPRATPKSEQIKQLRAHDAARMAIQSTVDDEYLIEPSLRKTKHCCIRLLNIIFSGYFASRIASSEDTATRAEIDTGEVGYRMRLWKKITDHFCNNKTDSNGLFVVDDPRFDGINPAYIVMHDAARLYDMWKKVMSKYGKADAKFFVSGQNSEEFFNFCEGSLDVMYLKACLDINPPATVIPILLG
ncbi:hypothetical protein PF010_g30216 [Phytophthora fragariae]|uniref:SAP domain-containing protein n=1 Tax=Phytophthora fragariae TaxID=53985 RepID=A0A6G0MD46_9STRA|nr:hypothetical protein PF010_g30216 [Phytophthora fragariae]KAE9163855.1 hypothetical protein PF004_g30012 [Phytophthora fragariae]